MRIWTRARALDALVLFCGACYFAMAMVPVSFWYDVGEITVADVEQGEPILLEYNGSAVRPFVGSYSVIARRFTSRQITCDASSAPFPYELDVDRPDPIPMEWWAPSDTRCHRLPAGAYSLKTCWTVHQPFWGLVPSKTECARAHFSVKPKI